MAPISPAKANETVQISFTLIVPFPITEDTGIIYVNVAPPPVVVPVAVMEKSLKVF